MAENDFDRTEPATPRRREEARRDGNIARSTDLTAACILLVTIILMNYWGLHVMGLLKGCLETMLAADPASNPTRIQDPRLLWMVAGKTVLLASAPVMLGAAAVALLCNLGQVGFLLTLKPLEPNISKLSPMRGLKHFWDGRSGMRLVMSLAKLALIGIVATIVVLQDMPQIVLLSELEVMPLFGIASQIVYSLALKLAALLLILAILDYAYQRWQHERDLRMTKEELKEEFKRMEGDPLIKQRRARVARQLLLQRINQAVPKADVIVTNPTHFAVALAYDSSKMSSPKVVAKGADFMAFRIRQLAIAHEVPIVERKELARALYANVEVGQQIPPQFYNAVAEILAYVYRLSGRKTA